MKCSQAHEWISEYVDGGLEAGKSRRLEEHLSLCAGCRELLEDFAAVKRTSAAIEVPPVPDAAWGRIRARLREERIAPRKAMPFLRPSPAVAFAALAIATIAAGAIFFSLRKSGRVEYGPEQKEQFVLAKLDEAEKHYELAIKSLSEALAAESGKPTPEVAEMFAGNMAAVDASIQACRRAVHSQPDDVAARDFLLAAYRKKIVLLDDLLQMNKNGFPGQEPGKAL
jgi:hypothetical protein